MSIKKLLSFGKKSKENDLTQTNDDESVSLSYSMDGKNTFDTMSDDTEAFEKPMSDILESDPDNKSELLELEELSKFDQTREFGEETKPKKSIFNFKKSKTSISEEDFQETSSEHDFSELPESKVKKGLFNFNKKAIPGNDFTKPEDEDESNLLKALAKKDKTNAHTVGAHSSSSLSESVYQSRQKKLPFIGSFTTAKQYQIIGVLAGLGVMFLIFGAYKYVSNSQEQTIGSQAVLKMKGDLQKLDSSFASSTVGKDKAFENMLDNFNKVKQDFVKVKEGNKNFTLQGAVDSQELQKDLEKNLSKLSYNIDKVKLQSDLLKNSANRVNQISNQVNYLSSQIDRLGMIYLQLGATQNELADIYLMKSTLQSMYSNASNLLLSESSNRETSLNLFQDRNNFKSYLNELYQGDESKGINPISYGVPYPTYRKLTTAWVHLADTMDTIIKRSPELLNVRNLAPLSTALINQMDSDLNNELDTYATYNYGGISTGKDIIMIGMILLVLASILVFYIYTIEKDNKALLEKIENNKNQASIFRLLNEMIPLQSGDLTTHATVTEEITGSIADSINATVGSLGSLVRKIKDTSFLMREKTNEVNIISLDMLKSNEEQTLAIQSAVSSVKNISNAIRNISEKTKKSAQAAQEATNVSEEGSKQVFESVKSMQTIDSTMNETDRLMGKVKHSSEQISEVVELLSDITENTYILALNAAVQSAKAGEAGKGFKIVADSIQELADSAQELQRRAGALIAAVQTDISEVSASVEKAKSEVKNGVNLSESAGSSLNKITEVANRLAGIVTEISKETITYAKTSDEISHNMETILDSTLITKNSTQKTANSITEIADISNELGESVQSFKVD